MAAEVRGRLLWNERCFQREEIVCVFSCVRGLEWVRKKCQMPYITSVAVHITLF